MSTTAAPTRPLLRYHGGKWELAPWIIGNFPPHRVYVEPFGGAASVLLQKPRSFAEVYNDLDDEIVNLFRVLRADRAHLEAAVRQTPFARTEYAEAFEATADPIERARRTLIRSHMGHAGAGTHGHRTGFRSHSVNSGSHPATQWRSFPEQLAALEDRFKGVVIENRDALEVIDQQDGERTLFYLDPPYVFASRDSGTDYRHELSDGQHETLAEKLTGIRGMAVLSGYHTPLYDRLYGDWHRVERPALAEGARLRMEVLWLNAAAMAALSHGSLFAPEVSRAS